MYQLSIYAKLMVLTEVLTPERSTANALVLHTRMSQPS